MVRSLLAAIAFASSSCLMAADDLRLDRVQESLTATWRHYQQTIDGVPVIGGERLERTTLEGKTEVVYDKRVARPTTSPVVARRVVGRSSVYVIRDGIARQAFRSVTFDTPLQPYVIFTDAVTGEVIGREPLFWRAAARVFDPNPVVKLNDPSLQDQNDSAAAVPAAAYTSVDIQGLAPTSPLTGPYARIVDLEPPFTSHADPAQSLMFDRSQKEFEEVNAYYHIDKTQRYLQSLGYTGTRQVVAYSIPIDPHAGDGADASYYIPGATPGQGTLFFGDGGTDDAEDSDLMVHEYGHAIQDWIAPGAFGGAHASESRALGEGFGDYLAFSARYPAAILSGRDPFCLGDWDARCWNDDPSQGCGYPPGSDCLRRVDSTKTMSDFLRSGGAGTEHENGKIWSSALRQIYLALVNRYGLTNGKRAADTIVIESHFGTPPGPTYQAMAERMLDADRLLNGGANSDSICAAMTVRGILSTCDRLPRGDRTLFQSPQQGIPIPDQDPIGIESQIVITDPRDIAKLYVHVDIAHPARGDLVITLVAPDGTQVVLQDSSLFDRSADVHATYGLDALPVQPLDVLNGRPAAGTWRLRVADVLPRDAGTLLSWSLLIQFVGDSPSPVRPASTAGSQFIAAVAHAPGANRTLWKSDVHLLNRGDANANVTLIFTPSGEDGNARFGAVKLTIAPSQVVALDDIVAQHFQSVGTGQLQITGDTANVIANARTYTGATRGTYGQFTPSVADGDFVSRGDAPVIVTQLRSGEAFRTNIGFAEVGGSAGTIRERLYDASTGTLIEENDFAIAPFSHRQELIRATVDSIVAEIDVIDGNARVIAYGTVVDNGTADPIYVPARRPDPAPRVEVAPVISAPGAFGTRWTSDVWITGTAVTTTTFVDGRTGERLDRSFDGAPAHGATRIDDIVSAAFHRPGSVGLLRVNVPAGSIVSSRISTPAAGGTFGQFVPFRSIDDPTLLVNGIETRRLTPVESSVFFRTNIGVANLGGLVARLRVVVHDSAGQTIGSRQLAVDPLQLIQIPIQTVIGDRILRNGWVSVELIEVSRGLLLYASVVDNASGDAVHLAAE